MRFDRLELRAGQRLLDFGCGGGRHALEAMRRGAVVTALDADPAEVAKAGAWVAAMLDDDKQTSDSGGTGHVVVGDGRTLPFADEAFDCVVASEVLEHVPDDERVVAELARVLRPGGVMAVTVPRWGPEKLNWALSDQYHNVPGGHIRIYRRSGLVGLLRGQGLVPYAGHHAHALHSPYWWLKCAVGIDKDNRLVELCHRLLVWDITAATPWTRWPETVLNPLIGKSLVVYAKKPLS
ncbi:MAG TPA: class I SAM-dependent methyltransferase [Acidimicrobiales bacterium]|nr:class I SAM-dependent methyltransferase [Acidimicrobiales bacterium]